MTSPSDRRRPLGLCQDWVMREQCWTVTGQKKTLETRWVRRVNLGWFIIDRSFSFGKEHAGLAQEKGKEEKELKEKEEWSRNGD